MRPVMLSTATPPDRFIGAYGPRWRSGLISEHLELFKAAGGVHRPSNSDGAGWAVIGGEAFPVVCSEIIEVWTEDGRQSGRCGEYALAETGACEPHSEERAAWIAMSEAERVHWEREHDAWNR